MAATRTKRSRFLPHTVTDEPPKKKKKSIGNNKEQQLEIIAPHPVLEGQPDNIILCIMSLLDLHSLVSLSRVCRRFHHLYSDDSIWSNVDLTRESVGCKLDSRKLKNIIRVCLPESVRCVKLSSNAFSLSSKQPTVTEPVLDLLFERCPNITSIALHKCDLTILSKSCSLYRATKLEQISFVECNTSQHWMKKVAPLWPDLNKLSFEGTAMIGDDDIEYIASSPCAKHLRHLNLRKCYRVTKNLLKYCSENFVQLRLLDIRNCANELIRSFELNSRDLKNIKNVLSSSVN